MAVLAKRRCSLLRTLALATLVVGLPTSPAQAEPQAYSEAEVKAAFLYNFPKFVDWPPTRGTNTNGDFVIGLLGSDPFGAVLDQALSGRAVREKRIVIRRLETIAAAGECQMLFVSSSESARLAEIIYKLRNRSILTVGEGEGFARQGGMIGLIIEDGKVRFDINSAAAREANLKMSANLLKLARTVVGEQGLAD